MRKPLIALVILIFMVNNLSSQILPEERRVDWTKVGIHSFNTNFPTIDMQTMGAVGNGEKPNDDLLKSVISSLSNGGIITFPSGEFLFNETIRLPSNIILRGNGAKNTIFKMNLGGSGAAIRAQGSLNKNVISSFIKSAQKDSNVIYVDNSSVFKPDSWIRVYQDDTAMVNNAWAIGTVGQIVQVDKVDENKLTLKSPLRLSYDLSNSPKIMEMNPVQNVGIECLKVLRVDDTAPEQGSNIRFDYAVNSWVNNIESENCTFAHIDARYSSNLSITNSYIHHGFSYGGGGRAYGVMFHFTTNECLVENNVFNTLRHAMIVQAGANGNVFGYNYSINPKRVDFIFTSSFIGDISIHGNYPYSNLFEHNVVHNIIFDDSHDVNGPYNTMFRNRAIEHGIFFIGETSSTQNIIGNEIPTTASSTSYYILGEDHFIHGNNVKGIIEPEGTNELVDKSYYKISDSKDYRIAINTENIATIGIPNELNTGVIPAIMDYETPGTLSYCNATDLVAPVDLQTFRVTRDNNDILIFWSTSSEINNDYFTIERSYDGSNFEAITVIEGNGTTSDRSEYSYLDQELHCGTIYYRIRQTDFNGEYTNYSIHSIETECDTEITIYPNPFNDQLKIRSLNKLKTVKVFDAFGALVLESNQSNINTSHLVKGVYLVECSFFNGVNMISKVIK